jgi:hypothetical protein
LVKPGNPPSVVAVSHNGWIVYEPVHAIPIMEIVRAGTTWHQAAELFKRCLERSGHPDIPIPALIAQIKAVEERTGALCQFQLWIFQDGYEIRPG